MKRLEEEGMLGRKVGRFVRCGRMDRADRDRHWWSWWKERMGLRDRNRLGGLVGEEELVVLSLWLSLQGVEKGRASCYFIVIGSMAVGMFVNFNGLVGP